MNNSKRVPVPLTDQEREEIQAAMKSEGIRTLADFMRIAALRLARMSASA
jgi:hypothetical protein